MDAKSQKPIGVFDSGLGGLTLVRGIRRSLPHESIVYFGDVARLPYGTKSKEQILAYSVQNTLFLLKHRVKAVVVACNSSSSAAFSFLKRNFKLPILDVIQPAVEHALEQTHSRRVGVIATQATIESEAYQKALHKASARLRVTSVACPLFVPLVEEGRLNDKIALEVAKNYLAPLKRKVDTLILGCTHYPLLKRTIQKVLGPRVQIVDSVGPSVKQLKSLLAEKSLIHKSKAKGKLQIFVSDRPRNFVRLAEEFLGEKLKSVKVVRQK